MNKAVRKAVIAGNWKMNKTPAEAKELITAIAPLVKDAGCDVVACVPYVDIATAIEAAKGTNIKIGAENVPLGGQRRFHRRDFRRNAEGLRR